jgi:predicted Zn-dependent peptidase
MMFKGTAKRTAEQVNLDFDVLGADYNAFTSEEQTVYYASVLPEYQSRVIEILSDMLRPSLRQEDFDVEKKVIIEEIRMYLDQPPYGADDLVRALHYGKHPLGRSVLGTVDSIAALPVDAMRDYFRRRYSPTNIVLVGAGKLDFDRLVLDAKQYCEHWDAIPAGRETPRPQGACKFDTLHKPQAVQEYVIQLSDGPSSTDEDRYAAKILSIIIGDDNGSRFFWELEDPGYAEQASLSHHEGQGGGAFVAYLACDPEMAADNLKRMSDIYAAIAADGVTDAELSQAKNKAESRIVLGSERSRGRLFNLAANWTQRREYRTVKADLDKYDSITRADVEAVVKKYPLVKNTTVCVGPLAEVARP